MPDTASPIRILIVDDHPIVRDGIRGMFTGDERFDVIGEASDGQEAINRTRVDRPDVVLMDLRMPGVDGVQATQAIVAEGLANVLILTTYDSETDVLPAIEAGATGYLLKDASRDDLIDAVFSAAKGESVLSPPIARQLMGRVREPRKTAVSERELEVLKLVAQGNTNKEIAAELFISEATVKTHLLHIYEKLEASDRASAVARGFELGLLSTGTGG